MPEFTPEWISVLASDEVFVFGSNADGLHVGGAAKVAHESFGARWGQGEGLSGQSYAIPTMGTIQELEAAVARFLTFARLAPHLQFYVTPIGTGIAGIPASTVAPLFRGHSENIIVPREFAAIIKGESL